MIEGFKAEPMSTCSFSACRRSFWSAARSGSSPGPPSDDASPSEGSGELDSPRQSESVGHSKATSSPPNAETLSPDRAAYEGIEMQPEEDIPARYVIH